MSNFKNKIMKKTLSWAYFACSSLLIIYIIYRASGIYMYILDKGTNIEITNMTIICIISLLLIISLYKLFK